MAEDLDQRKLLSALCHGSIFFGTLFFSVAIPIIVLLMSKDDVAKANAKEALNFHFNLWLYEIIFFILTLILIGWILLGILAIVNLIMPIIAIINVLTKPETAYRYPFIFRLL
ncbi:DUF4870 domain-containing protein [Euhalothece natronophila Z-M001]|uniref:DUF4870 domain-containing protein n=1 Tax=Euhalothece natronophila Z-M001 TaxID=522448 RepID=A0A5B8NL26_9CHRO|nr:DUF4870 domain-containing protein [Euhalothece natronophila]QDZ39025.1 DUF4870 domain-containing protein [Euhalothece natronophila Z-M001]